MTKRKPTKKTTKPTTLAKEIAVALHTETKPAPKATIDLIPKVDWSRP